MNLSTLFVFPAQWTYLWFFSVALRVVRSKSNNYTRRARFATPQPCPLWKTIKDVVFVSSLSAKSVINRSTLDVRRVDLECQRLDFLQVNERMIRCRYPGYNYWDILSNYCGNRIDVLLE
jgi:hypothetical protein